jgi:hypothetical protein
MSFSRIPLFSHVLTIFLVLLYSAVYCEQGHGQSGQSNCDIHQGTFVNDAGTTVTQTGWPAGTAVSVRFETGNTGDLSSVQQQQFMNGLNYWSSATGISFVNAGSSSSSTSETNTLWVHANSSLASDNPEDTSLTVDQQTGATIFANTALNPSYTTGSIYNNFIPTAQQASFSSAYIYFVGAHVGGHTNGADDDYGTDGQSAMNVYTISDIKNDGYSTVQTNITISTPQSSMTSCDANEMKTIYSCSGNVCYSSSCDGYSCDRCGSNCGGGCSGDNNCAGGLVCIGGICGCSNPCDDTSCDGYSCASCGTNCGGGCGTSDSCPGGTVCMGSQCGCGNICDDSSCDGYSYCACNDDPCTCDGWCGGTGGPGPGGGGETNCFWVWANGTQVWVCAGEIGTCW